MFTEDDGFFEIELADGEVLKGDKMLINMINSQEDVLEGVILGEWGIKDLIDNKIYLSDLLQEAIFGKIPEHKRGLAKEIKTDLDELKSDFFKNLSKGKKEIYLEYFAPSAVLDLEDEGVIEFGEAGFNDKDELLDFLNNNLENFVELTDESDETESDKIDKAESDNKDNVIKVDFKNKKQL